MSEFNASNLKPGQTLHLTVTKLPQSHGDTQTMLRLMRLDAENKRALRRAYHMRAQRMVVYNRGNRDWVSRERPARVVRVEVGRNWSMPFTHDRVADLNVIAPFVDIKSK